MSVLAPGRNIVLIGMMGAGKTTVGRLLAAELGRPFVDTDTLIEADAGTSIAEIFATEGERGFRRREAAAVRAASALRGQVVAVGGGAIIDPANVTALRGTGDLVYLATQPEHLAERLGEAELAARPLLGVRPAAGTVPAPPPAVRIAALAADRDRLYRAAAATVIETDSLSPETVADAIRIWAQSRAGLLSPEERAT